MAEMLMAYPDTGPLLDEHLDELELICRASERGGSFREEEGGTIGGGMLDALEVMGYMLDWHGKHDRKLLEAARWALRHGWSQESATP